MTRTRSSTPPPLRAVAGIAGVLYVGIVLWITLRPAPWATDGNQTPYGVLNPAAWVDLQGWVEGRPLEVLLNVAMFLPIGLAAGVALRGPARLIAPLALTLAIELAQIPLDRISHPRDLIANGAGAVIGLLLAGAVRRRWQTAPTRRAPTRA